MNWTVDPSECVSMLWPAPAQQLPLGMTPSPYPVPLLACWHVAMLPCLPCLPMSARELVAVEAPKHRA